MSDLRAIAQRYGLPWTPAVQAALEEASKSRAANGPAPYADEAVLGRIRAMRAAGSSLRGVADALNADGVPTPRGRGPWKAGTIQYLEQRMRR